jgi:hypothetical protein
MNPFYVYISMNRDLESDGIECTIVLTSENNPTHTLHFSQEKKSSPMVSPCQLI